MILKETEKLQKLFGKRKIFKYKKGEIILRSGDMSQGVMLLKSGYARLESISKEGKELTMVIYKPGEFFPVVWTFFGQNPSVYDIEALTDCEIIRVPREEFLEITRRNSDLLIDLTKHIITRFQLALQRMAFLTFGDASAKLASILLILAKEYGVEKQNSFEIQIPLTHKDIANLVGVTRETVSIELKKFDRKGIISYNKKILLIKNKEALQKKAIF